MSDLLFYILLGVGLVILTLAIIFGGLYLGKRYNRKVNIKHNSKFGEIVAIAFLIDLFRYR